MNICFIGGGNMASAMLGGLLRNGTCKPGDIRVVEINEQVRAQMKSQGIEVFDAIGTEAIKGADVVVLAVKPQVMQGVADQLGSVLSGRQVVLSIAAGMRLVDLGGWLGNVYDDEGYVLVRAMPNTPALIGAGMTGLYGFPPELGFPTLDDAQRRSVEEIMSAIGSFVWIRGEDGMDAVTAVSGSGPAYFFYFIEALEQAGRELGLPPETARKLALETALGAAKLAHESPEDPATLRARVTSKNGTTERALDNMNDNHVKEHIIAAVKAAAARAREMGDELGGA